MVPAIYYPLVLLLTIIGDSRGEMGISKQILENWSSKFGGPLYEFGRSVTKYNELQNRFNTHPTTSITRTDLSQLIRQVQNEMNIVLREKVEAVRKIMLWSEEKALEHHSTPINKQRLPQTYYNAKKLNVEEHGHDPENLYHQVQLEKNHHFYDDRVNTSFSVVHVPTSIYEKMDSLLYSIGWTSNMDSTFESNYLTNPTLNYQYFGSSTGFLRQYPGAKWPNENSGKSTSPDLYDARTRPWYVSAANSPKNLIILQDTSGSMTGLRREISKHVVSTILDTLTENDYVNVYNFSEETGPVVECFRGQLVQANLENIRILKEALDQEQTTKVANFTRALHTAFDILEKSYNHPTQSSGCNQAIMIVTDGAPYNYEEIFNMRQNKERFVRVFTYLIGRDVQDKREVMFMACANNGFFAHVSTLSEVQEQVLKYIPVMARPLVMLKHQNHPISWTGVYADIKAPDERPKDDLRFVVSVSVPVYDLRNESSEGPLANLLGVAGTDIPIKELQKIPSPFKLGVGGYSYLVNNNGYVVYHPEHRPVYRGDLLKPNYNTVDFSEVELVEGGGSRNDSVLLEMRKDLLQSTHSYNLLKKSIRHLENFHRVSIRSQKHEYVKIQNTSYTLGLSTPENLNTFNGQMELFLEREQGHDVVSYFDEINTSDRKWMINPNWNYCEYVRGGSEFDSKEELLLHFIRKIQNAKKGWKWKNTGVGIKQRHNNHNANGNKVKKGVVEGDVYECDRDLVQSLVFDANITEVFSEKKLWKINREDKKLIELNGATQAFLATRSGLTRWIDFEKKKPLNPPLPMATDSPWYKRAVDRYEIDPESFVYSVPFDVGARNDTRVTATRAVFVEKNGLKAPVAVVGVVYKHDEWSRRFLDITGTCVETSNKPGLSNYVDSCKTCDSAEYDCFVLDDNGFVLISENNEQTGKFFGEIDGMVMEMLVNSDVYKRVKVIDYQGVCFQPVFKSSVGSYLRFDPITQAKSILTALLAVLLNILSNLNLNLIWTQESAAEHYTIIEESANEGLYPFSELASINKTRLRPCDKETTLYTYGSAYNVFNFSYHGLLTKCGHSSQCDGYFNVHFIPHTNLILVVTDGKCNCLMNSTNIRMKEVEYGKIGECGEDVVAKQSLFREKLNDCWHYNANEPVDMCGSGSRSRVKVNLFIFLVILLLKIE